MVVIPKRSGNEAVKQLFRNAGAEVLEERDLRPFNGSTVAPNSKLKEKAYAIGGYYFTRKLSQRLVRDVRPDLLHLNSTCMVAAAAGAKSVDRQLPVIAHVREPILQNHWGKWLARMNRQQVDYFVSIDRAGLNSIGVGRDRSEIIFNFVDTDRFVRSDTLRKVERSIHHWPEHTVVFLLLSRVAESNGPLEFLDAVERREREIDPRARFVVAGFDEPYSVYEQATLARVQRSRRFHALPFSSRVVELLNGCDVVVAPFQTAHSARCIFEGATVGRPGLVSRLPNLTELIQEGETGFSYPVDDENALVDAINRLCIDDTRARMGEAAHHFSSANFSSETNVARTVAVYEKLLARRAH